MSDGTPQRMVLRASRLIDGTGAAPADDPVLVVTGGRIEAVCQGDLPPALREGAVFVDLPGKTLLPGLIDSHVHLVFETGPDHAAVRRRLAEEDDQYLLLRALHNAQALLRAGVTTARDCGDRGFVTLKARRAIDEGLFAGPRLVCCGPPITTTGGHLHYCGLRADSLDEVRRAVRTVVERGADHVKIVATGGMMTPGSNHRRCQYSPEELKAAAFEAHRLGKRVATHLLGIEGIQPCLQAGIDTFEHCNWSAPDEETGFEFRPELAREIARHGVACGHTVVGLYRDLLPDPEATEETQAEQLRQLREQQERFRQMLDAGIRMMLSSDAGVAGTPFDRFADGLEVAVLGIGMSPLAAIEACTRVPAEALGMRDEIGTLVPGKRADIVATDGDPSVDIAAMRRVSLVMRDGRILHENRADDHEPA